MQVCLLFTRASFRSLTPFPIDFRRDNIASQFPCMIGDWKINNFLFVYHLRIYFDVRSCKFKEYLLKWVYLNVQRTSCLYIRVYGRAHEGRSSQVPAETKFDESTFSVYAVRKAHVYHKRRKRFYGLATCCVSAFTGVRALATTQWSDISEIAASECTVWPLLWVYRYDTTWNGHTMQAAPSTTYRHDTTRYHVERKTVTESTPRDWDQGNSRRLQQLDDVSNVDRISDLKHGLQCWR